MNEQRHKDREISSGNAPRPFSPPSSSDKCDKRVLPHVLGTQTPGCPQSSPRLCRHLPLSISQGASLNLALIIRVTKTICNLFQYPNFKHRTCFFQNTLAPHLQTRIQCLGWGQPLCTQPWKTRLLPSQVALMVAEG